MPQISTHLRSREPSAIRQAQILFAQRPDRGLVRVVNVAVGNVSLPMHPSMRRRMVGLGDPDSPFAGGVVKYTETVGTEEARAAVLRLIRASGASSEGLHPIVTDGGSRAMELAVLAACSPGDARPILLADPAYTNYPDIARRMGVRTVAARRELGRDGAFDPPDPDALEAVIRAENPAALVVIPADNPTGQFLGQSTLVRLAELCVRHDIWMVSDEAYRELSYTGAPASTVWAIPDAEVPGIRGRRISIESASKVWNACGLRIGALVTDEPELHRRAVAEYTANLCASAIGQYIFGALAHESDADLAAWFTQQRATYGELIRGVVEGLRARVPGLIVSRPDAALYCVVDVRDLVPNGFVAGEFVRWCAEKGRIPLEGTDHTLLVAPMRGFYVGPRTREVDCQMRIAFVEPPAEMAKIPELFARLLEAYVSS